MTASTPQILIRPLSPGVLDDYLYFFDHVAFADHQEWSWCYCTYYHLGKQDEAEIEARGNFNKDVLRTIAIDLIKEGKLNGYLAYTDGKVIGWSNVSDKKNYKKLCENREIWDDGEELPVKSVTCFIVAPEARRKGVAAALLTRAAEDAAKEGYRAIEAYPATGDLDCFLHYHGHPAMYTKSGFVLYKELKDYSVYRKTL
jgi:GNAT superfamily N-acetyltransferase